MLHRSTNLTSLERGMYLFIYMQAIKWRKTTCSEFVLSSRTSQNGHDAKIAHFAYHGVRNGMDPLNSALILEKREAEKVV